MATKPAQIIEGAYRRSKRSAAGKLIDEASEGLAHVNDAVRAMFMIAARINPTYYGARSNVPFAGGGWLRPGNAESVFYMEQDADPVLVVPAWDRRAALMEKAVYRLGRTYYGAGNAGDPVGGVLTVWYSRLPGAAETINTDLDALWPESHNPLLELETALYLAIKDGRADEVPGLVTQRDQALRLYLAHLEHETTNEVRRFSRRYAPDLAVIPLESLLAGGTNVKLGAAA